jgi:hypothetical protein
MQANQPIGDFNFDTINNLSRSQAKEYLINYIVPLDTGSHCVYLNNRYVIKEHDVVKRVYLDRIDKELSKWYLKEFTGVKTVTYAFNKPVFFENFINLAPISKNIYNPHYVMTDSASDDLHVILNFIRDVLCSGKNDSYIFVLNWISNMLRGNKNNSALYLKGPQGIGKSSLYYFLSRFVLGTKICVESGSDPLRTKFNEILGGKMLVCFEELENFSRSEWESISSTLKRMITSENIVLQNKCTKAYEATNMNNYMLCSNNDAIKDDDGRRYFIMDISTKYIGCRSYYDRLYNAFNDESGEAFFNYVYNLCPDGFNPQAFPITNNKTDSLTKRIDPVYKFIKEHFIFNDVGLDISATDLYDMFKTNYDKSDGKLSKEDFNRKLSEAGFKRTKKNNKLWYDVTHDQLLETANKRKWISIYDEYTPKMMISDSETSDDDTMMISDTDSEKTKNKRSLILALDNGL